jgi:alpha-1,2-mannosyltransferase
VEPPVAAPASSIAFPSLLLAGRKALTLLVALAPLALGVFVLRHEAQLGVLGFDFKGTIWQPGRDILAGHSPYPPTRLDAIDRGNPSVYPPLVLLLTAPLALLPFSVAYWTWAAVLAAGTFASLWPLGVRDWRCYTLALGSCPVVWGLAFGNVSLLLVPIAAFAWRYRSSLGRCAAAVGLAVALKIVLWPLLVWLVVTRRSRAALLAAAGAVVSIVLAWAVIGFDGFREYPRLLALNTDFYGPHSWSLAAAGLGLGLPLSLAKLLSSLLGVALLAGAFVAARRAGCDKSAFSLVLIASLALTPIVWPYYFAILLVPIALSSASFGRAWYLLAAFWFVAFVPRAVTDTSTPPDGVPPDVWHMHHSGPPAAQAAAFAALTALVAASVLARRAR